MRQSRGDLATLDRLRRDGALERKGQTIFATFNFQICVGLKTLVREATRELEDNYSYTNQPSYAARYIDGTAAAMLRPFGQEIKYDSLVWTRSVDNVLANRFTLAQQERQQVRLTDKYGNVSFWNATSAWDLAQFPIFRVIALSRWG